MSLVEVKENLGSLAVPPLQQCEAVVPPLVLSECGRGWGCALAPAPLTQALALATRASHHVQKKMKASRERCNKASTTGVREGVESAPPPPPPPPPDSSHSGPFALSLWSTITSPGGGVSPDAVCVHTRRWEQPLSRCGEVPGHTATVPS